MHFRFYAKSINRTAFSAVHGKYVALSSMLPLISAQLNALFNDVQLLVTLLSDTPFAP